MTTIINTLSNIARVLCLLFQGFLSGSRFARFEFRRSFLRPWLDQAGVVLAWLVAGVAGVAGVVALCVAVWLFLWLASSLGVTM